MPRFIILESQFQCFLFFKNIYNIIIATNCYKDNSNKILIKKLLYKDLNEYFQNMNLLKIKVFLKISEKHLKKYYIKKEF